MAKGERGRGRERGMYRHIDFAEHSDTLDGVFERDILRCRNDDGSCFSHQPQLVFFS